MATTPAPECSLYRLEGMNRRRNHAAMSFRTAPSLRNRWYARLSAGGRWIRTSSTRARGQSGCRPFWVGCALRSGAGPGEALLGQRGISEAASAHWESIRRRWAPRRLLAAVLRRVSLASVGGLCRCARGPGCYDDEPPPNALWLGHGARVHAHARLRDDDGRRPHDAPQRCDGVPPTGGWLLIAPSKSPSRLGVVRPSPESRMPPSRSVSLPERWRLSQRLLR